MSDEVAVLGCGAFVPGYGGLKGWAESTPSEHRETPTGEMVPPRQRRRTSPLTKAFADAFSEATGSTGLDLTSVASVFGSAIGEASTMIGLLNQMWSKPANLSPMKFATSVHNAASGVISIASANRGMTTAIGADYDTPAMSLLEGIGLVLDRGEAVVVCCGDEAPPPDLVPKGVEWSLMAAAIALGPTSEALPARPQLSQLGIAEPTLFSQAGAGEAGERVDRNPNIGLLDLVVAIHNGSAGVVRLDRGTGRGYSIRLRALSG